MPPADHPAVRLRVNNLAQMLAHMHGCGIDSKPVCDACRLEARATYTRLSGNVLEPA